MRITFSCGGPRGLTRLYHHFEVMYANDRDSQETIYGAFASGVGGDSGICLSKRQEGHFQKALRVPDGSLCLGIAGFRKRSKEDVFHEWASLSGSVSAMEF